VRVPKRWISPSSHARGGTYAKSELNRPNRSLRTYLPLRRHSHRVGCRELNDDSQQPEGAERVEASGVDTDGKRIKRLFSNASIYAIGTVSLQLFTAILAPVLTYFLSPDEFGIWTLSMMVFIGLSNIFNPALHGAVNRFYYEHEDDEVARRRFQGTIVTFLLIWSLLLSVFLTVIGPWLFETLFVDLPFYPYGLLVVWMACINTLGVVPKATWAAAERSKTFVGVELLSSFFYVGGALFLVSLTTLGVLGLFYGRALGLLVVAIPYIVFTVRRVGLQWQPMLLRRALVFSLPLVPHLFAHWILGMSDRFIIEHQLGMASVGIYGAGYAFIEVVAMVVMATNRAWLPQFTRSYGDTAEHPYIGKSITYFVLVIVSFSAALTVLSPSLVHLLFPDAYAGAAEIAPILALGGCFQGLYFIYVNGLFYFKKNLMVPVITIVAGAVNVLLNLLWIPEYGLVGAAWATLLGYGVLALGSRWACRRYTKLPFEHTRLRKLFLIAGLVVTLGLVIQGRWEPGLELMAQAGLLVLGVATLAMSGFWTHEELSWWRRLLRRERT
jgi:O-antigen/teichoic acid export membrane protein